MSDEMSGERDEIRARLLCAQARAREAGGDYAAARRLYEQSLMLREDADVRKAYLKLLSKLGPM